MKQYDIIPHYKYITIDKSGFVEMWTVKPIPNKTINGWLFRKDASDKSTRTLLGKIDANIVIPNWDKQIMKIDNTNCSITL